MASHQGVLAEHFTDLEQQRQTETLGMWTFLATEIMIFGAFFTAYFFIRVANHNPWPAHGTTLPEAVAGINTSSRVPWPGWAGLCSCTPARKLVRNGPTPP